MIRPRMPIPPDTDPGSLDATDAISRRLQTPPEVMPARLPQRPTPLSVGAEPGPSALRGPSAAARRPARRAEATTEALTTRLERLEPDPAPLPPSPAAADASRWLEREQPRFDTAPTEIAESSDATRPVAAPTPPPLRVGHSSTFTALLALTMLVIGMILGALIAGR